MLARILKIGAVLLILGFCLAGYVRLRKENSTLRVELAAVRAQDEERGRLAEENRGLATLVSRAKTDRSDALRAIHAETEKARAEVAELERKAEERHVAKVARDRVKNEALATNRDLTKGPVLVENCANVGRATPVDALQTLVWAGMKGDDDLVVSMIALDGKTRAAVAALLAVLPAGAREKYPTPEKLGALVWADVVTNLAAVQVTAQTPLDRGRVVLTVGKLSGNTVDLVMEPGPNGWQVATADRKIFDQFKARILGAESGVAAKK